MSRNYGSENAPRDLLGVIATLDDGTVLHRSKLADVCAYCDEHGLKIACLSSWRTILTDLTANRLVNDPNKRGSYMNRPEWSMLSREGRLDLLVPVSARV